jgi:hypothetical protein
MHAADVVDVVGNHARAVGGKDAAQVRPVFSPVFGQQAIGAQPGDAGAGDDLPAWRFTRAGTL